MGKTNKPRAGSMSFYPRVRAKSIIPKFNSFADPKKIGITGAKPLCFYVFKAGTTHVIAKNAKKGASSYGQENSISVSVLEAPDMKVIGARFYKENHPTKGKTAIFEFSNQDNLVKKRISGKKQKKVTPLEEALKRKEEADSLVLLATVNPDKTTVGQKKPVIVEVPLSGTYEEQISYLSEKLNKTIAVSEVFDVETVLDVKGVTIGHGTQGPVKRFGIKIQRPKAQKIQRHVGSINPWHPATVMYTIPRAGQYGFHNRTTFNKKLLMIDEDTSKINPKKGFINYGLVKNKYLLVAGSVPGPTKRILALRHTIREKPKTKLEVTDINYISK